MLLVKHKDKKYNVPESWDEATLADLIAMESVRANYPEAEASRRIVEALTKIPPRVQDELAAIQYARIINALRFTEAAPSAIATSITAAGVPYASGAGFLNSSFRQWTVASYYHRKFSEKQRAYAMLPYVAAIFYLRNGETYEELERSKEGAFEARVETMRLMSAADAIGVMNFFLKICAIFSKSSRAYLLQTTANQLDTVSTELNHLGKNIRGSASLRNSRMETLASSMQFSMNRLAASLRTLATAPTRPKLKD